MNKRLRIAFGVLLVGVFAVAALLGFRTREPSYQGKPLSTWLEDFRTNAESSDFTPQPAMQALKDIGPRAIPYLLRAIRAQDSPVKEKIADWLNNKFDLEWKVQRAEDLRQNAVAGFFLLGERGEPAIPALAEAITNKDWFIARLAMEALWAIGTSNCVPLLVQALTNSDNKIQDQAAFLLGQMRGKATSAAPALLARLDDKNAQVRLRAVHALGNVGAKLNTTVPALRGRLADPDAMVRAAAASWLGAFVPEARSATEVLQNLKDDPDQKVRAAAARALVRLQCETRDGGIFRGPTAERKIALVFTAHEFAEGGEAILNELERCGAKASFFLTGDFLANARFASLIQRMTNGGHYIGPHSDKHLLYCDWGAAAKTLVTRDEFWFDLTANLKKLERLGVKRSWPSFFLPAYEHYNREIADWSLQWGLGIITFTPGTRSNADYTGEADANFVSSQAIFESIVRREREDPHGLNGFILLLHLGSGPGRADKFHPRFGELLDTLAAKGYQFVRVDELLEPKAEETPKLDPPPAQPKAPDAK